MAMIRTLLALAVTLFVAGAALLLGLVGGSLRTGRLDPLDWLLPGAAAIILLSLLAWRGSRAHGGDGERTRTPWIISAAIWALVTLPPLLLLARAGVAAPLAGMALLSLTLALTAMACTTVRHSAVAGRIVTSVALLGAAVGAPYLLDSVRGQGPAEAADRPLVAVMTAMPLQGVAMGAALGLPAMESIGLRSPLWQALETHFRLRPLDALDGDALTDIGTLLLAQPRALAPEELVALDAWVRAGGRAVILADPLLHWPDPRPLAHPARAPLTSLLDPLLAHWGLQLAPAQLDMSDGAHAHAPERRALASNALLQLAGASHFTLAGSSPSCALAEDGLVARCRPGEGRALLFADADWIDDALWTLAPEQPTDRRHWTSDAPQVLVAWLRGEEADVGHLVSWVADRDALVRALRAALLLLLALSAGVVAVGRRPHASQVQENTERDHKRNINKTESNTS